MRQGMDRGGKASPDRRGTSRAQKPATGRMNAQQGSGTSRRDSQQDGRSGPAPQQQDKTMLYIGIGGGALVFVLILAFMLSGGGESRSSGSGGADSLVNRAISKATEAHQRGEYREGLNIAESALSDPKARKSSRFNALQALANSLRAIVNLDKTAQEKVGDFKRRIDAAKADQTAMAKANDFYDECLRLLGEYGATTSAPTLRGIKEDLGRWVSTERQGNWQKDYNTTKARIEKSFLSEQRYGEAIREWNRFGETSQDPLLHSRIEQEVRTVNQQAVTAAEKLVQEATGDRTKLEEAQQKFSGSEGQAVLTKAIRGIK
jgi:hypothetical protein